MAKKRQKTKKFSFQGFDNKHYRTTQSYVNAVNLLFDRATAEIAKNAYKIDPNKPFSFDDYPQTKKTVNSIVSDLANKMTAVVSAGSRKQWLFACKKNDDFVASILDTSKLSKARLNKMQDRNLDSLQTFQERKVGGMDLSKRVWRYTEQYKAQIELGLDVGLAEGRSAQQLSRDLRQNLKDPNRLFRRVRDKRGNLQLSKAAKAFNPGQGVYRSSAKNAERLTRSEINMAYREADWLRWQQLDFVVGFNVQRSNKEPRFKCKLCDKLVGRYPKSFKFKGWHPQCMCYATAILMDEKTFDEQELSDLKAALRGTEYKKLEAKNAVTDMPQGFKEWVAENKEKQANWKSAPYFIRDNFKNGKMSEGLRFESTQEQVQKPEQDSKAQEMVLLRPEIESIKSKCLEWGVNSKVLDFMVSRGEPSEVRKAIDYTQRLIDTAKKQFNSILGEIRAVESQAKEAGINSVVLKMLEIDLMANKANIANLKSKISVEIERLRKEILAEKMNKEGYSSNMPAGLKIGDDYLQGEKYQFKKEFFDLIDPERPIKLEIVTREDGAYYSAGKVHLCNAKRNKNSSWHRKSVVYHEFGHAIDWQRDLRKSKDLADLRTKQIKTLKKQSTYKLWAREFDYEKRKYISKKIEQKISKVAYIDRKLEQLSAKVFKMKDEMFTKRGISRWDVLEQIGSTRDTIKSLVVSYGFGHSTTYFRQSGMKEAEYLAHAFENAFIGNAVFKKYLPEIYNEMIVYIRTLKPL